MRAWEMTATSESAMTSARGDVDQERMARSGGACVTVRLTGPPLTRRVRRRLLPASSAATRAKPPLDSKAVPGADAAAATGASVSRCVFEPPRDPGATSTVSAYMAWTKDRSSSNDCEEEWRG